MTSKIKANEQQVQLKVKMPIKLMTFISNYTNLNFATVKTLNEIK